MAVMGSLFNVYSTICNKELLSNYICKIIDREGRS